MAHKRKKLGNWGEQYAARFFVTKGYTIVARNYRIRIAEIDLVCTNETDIVFVEVKTRQQQVFGGGVASVDVKKRRKIAQAIEAYLAKNPTQKAVRFDVVVVNVVGLTAEVEYYEDCPLF